MSFPGRPFSGVSIEQLNPQQVQDRMTQDPGAFLLDVREPDEYTRGHIAGAELISIRELAQHMSRIPKDREVICVCQSGSRSSMAAQHLAASGYRVANLKFGMMAWMQAGFPIQQGMAK
jgi:rhodanese-related sulfurtransferase